MNKSFIDKIGQKLIKKKRSVAVAESVTAGHIQAALSLAKDASKFFQGGITVYNPGQKTRHLNIEPIHALECNAVSTQVATQMAINTCRLFVADYGLAITGFASLKPEDGINDLFAFVSIAKNNKILVTRKIIPTKNSKPHTVQLFYTDAALKLLEKFI